MAKRALITGGIIFTAVILALGMTKILPQWIFHLVVLVLLVSGWAWLTLRIWPRLTSRQRGWFGFWNYAVPWMAVLPTVIVFEQADAPFAERLYVRLYAAFFTGTCIGVIYI